MAYKIAIGTSDGENIDVSFGAAQYFDIYEVEGEEYSYFEKREYVAPGDNESEKENNSEVSKAIACGNADNETTGGCGNGSAGGCGNGSANGCGNGKAGGGCGGNGAAIPKVEILADCRSIVCKKIGFNVTKQLEKKAIVGFDVECPVKVALDKITKYFYKVDSHQSLRGSAREN